jgi:MFS family permease
LFVSILILSVFGQPQGAIKGILAASYSLGAILSLPFVPMFNQYFGRRWSIMFGSIVMVIGAILQGFSNGSEIFHSFSNAIY